MKLSGAMDTRARGPASEVIASCLAGHFGIERPEPAAVSLHPDLANWLIANRSDLAEVVRTSLGPNFGTTLLTDVATCPVGRDLPDAMLPAAADIFAFDALIANYDRRRRNPNILIRGDHLFVIDHEAAFGFLYPGGSREQAWDLHQRPLRDHVFYYQLRKRPIDFSTFIRRLAALGDDVLETIIRQVPIEWRHDDMGRICAHLQTIRDHAADFARQVLEALA